MFQRKYHTIVVDKNGERRFFPGFYRNSSIKYWQRYRENFIKNNPGIKFDIFISKKDETLVDKVKVVYLTGETWLIISDSILKEEYPELYRRA